MKTLIRNDCIHLAYTEEQDIPFVVDIEHRPENAKYIGQWSFEQHEGAIHDPDILHLLIKDSGDHTVGYAIIKGMTDTHDCIQLKRIAIIDKGRGYGKHALALIIKWCFEVQKAHRLWLDVQDNNPRAQHVYEAQGFVREGVLRECLKDGTAYLSLIVMSILKQDYTATS